MHVVSITKFIFYYAEVQGSHFTMALSLSPQGYAPVLPVLPDLPECQVHSLLEVSWLRFRILLETLQSQDRSKWHLSRSAEQSIVWILSSGHQGVLRLCLIILSVVTVSEFRLSGVVLDVVRILTELFTCLKGNFYCAHYTNSIKYVTDNFPPAKIILIHKLTGRDCSIHYAHDPHKFRTDRVPTLRWRTYLGLLCGLQSYL